jgi:hypothetical protein
LAQAFGLAWGGIIWSETEDPVDDVTRLLLKYSLYSHADKWENLSDRVGWNGTGAGSEVFNSLTNKSSGGASHAEGFRTTASGNSSHAEGRSSHAAGRSQHAQGEYNEIDPEYNADAPGMRGKYAHIVGNGTADTARSNAHTLDWNGLGWFAGGLKVGGTGQDDENAVAVLTTADMDDITAAVLSALPIYNGEVEEV